MAGQLKDKWYFIVVQSPGTSEEQILGYTHEETGATFIPAFESKEIAQQCFLIMPKDIMNEKYEVQAIIKEDLLLHATNKGFDVILMDDKGQILKPIK